MYVDRYSGEGQRPTQFELIDEDNPWHGVYYTWNGVYYARREVTYAEDAIDTIYITGLEEYTFYFDGFGAPFRSSCIITLSEERNKLKVRYEVPFNDKGCMRDEWSDNDVIIPFGDFNCRQDESSGDIYILIDDLFSIRLNDNIERR